jgi:hypothetical protein
MGRRARLASGQSRRKHGPGDCPVEAAERIGPVLLFRLFQLRADLSGLPRRGQATHPRRTGAGARGRRGRANRRLLRSPAAADQSRPCPLCPGAGRAGPQRSAGCGARGVARRHDERHGGSQPAVAAGGDTDPRRSRRADGSAAVGGRGCAGRTAAALCLARRAHRLPCPGRTGQRARSRRRRAAPAHRPAAVGRLCLQPRADAAHQRPGRRRRGAGRQHATTIPR